MNTFVCVSVIAEPFDWRSVHLRVSNFLNVLNESMDVACSSVEAVLRLRRCVLHSHCYLSRQRDVQITHDHETSPFIAFFISFVLFVSPKPLPPQVPFILTETSFGTAAINIYTRKYIAFISPAFMLCARSRIGLLCFALLIFV